MNKPSEHPQDFRTTIGGQALIEGILMRGPEKQAIVIRKPDGELETKIEELHLIKERHPILGVPLIRGAVNFLDSMVKGVKALMYSAEFYPEDEEEEVQPSKFETWLENKLGSEGMTKIVVALAVILGIGFSVCLFILLPAFLGGCCKKLFPVTWCATCWRACCASPSFWPISSSAPSRRTSSGSLPTTGQNISLSSATKRGWS